MGNLLAGLVEKTGHLVINLLKVDKPGQQPGETAEGIEKRVDALSGPLCQALTKVRIVEEPAKTFQQGRDFAFELVQQHLDQVCRQQVAQGFFALQQAFDALVDKGLHRPGCFRRLHDCCQPAVQVTL